MKVSARQRFSEIIATDFHDHSPISSSSSQPLHVRAMVIPYDVPIILQSVRTQKNLQNPPGSRKARCLVDNRDVYERVILHLVEGNKVSFQSEHSGRYLQVSTSTSCVFDPKTDGRWEHFTMECDADGNLHFISCHTGTVLICNDKGVVKCPSENRYYWAAWRIVEPRAIVTLVQVAPAQHHALSGKERQSFILELVKCGKSTEEIEQIVTRMFDAIPSRSAVFAVPVEKREVVVDKKETVDKKAPS